MSHENRNLRTAPERFVVTALRTYHVYDYVPFAKSLALLDFSRWHAFCVGTAFVSRNNYRESNMDYKKYEVHSRLFALRDPRLSAQVLAAFSGAARKPIVPPPPPRSIKSR
jgi:hypothetical protein